MSATLLAGCAVSCGVASLLELVQAPRRPRRAARSGPLVHLLAVLGTRVGLRVPAAADLEARLAAAGVSPRLTADDVVAIKTGAAAAGLLLAIGLAPSAPGRLSVLLLAIAPATGFLWPDAWLGRRARQRSSEMAADLPDVLDLLRVTLASSLPLSSALAAVGANRRGLLARELSATADQMALGLGRAVALRQLGARCPLPGVLAFVATAERSERHGSPLGPALAAIARDARADRARRRADQAARAAPKIQLVVALLLVPAAMLLLGAGMVAGFS